MKKNILALLYCIVCSILFSHLHAQDDTAQKQITIVKDILNKEKTYFSILNSISFVGTENILIVSDGVENGKKGTRKVEFTQKGEKFRYKIEQTTEFDTPYVSDSALYDGTSFQRMNGTILSISKGCPASIPGLSNHLYFAMPFSFVVDAVAATQPKENTFVLRVNQFQEAKTWDVALNHVVSISEGTLQNKTGLLVKFTGVWAGDPVRISVLFDPKQNYYPIAWERYSAENRGFTYVINEFGTFEVGNATFPYPKKATLTQYCGSPKPAAISTISVDKLLVNQKGIHDDDFNIDPAQATYIYDEEHDKMIHVPN